jgi:hypothetical protein
MGVHFGVPYGSFAIICFGDGTIPEVLIDCMQFRLVADRAAAGGAGEGHLLQLQRHIGRRCCRDCHKYLVGRMAERRLRNRRIAAP